MPIITLTEDERDLIVQVMGRVFDEYRPDSRGDLAQFAAGSLAADVGERTRSAKAVWVDDERKFTVDLPAPAAVALWIEKHAAEDDPRVDLLKKLNDACWPVR